MKKEIIKTLLLVIVGFLIGWGIGQLIKAEQ